MFHPDTQFLIDSWLDLARPSDVRGGVPARSSLRPELLGARLSRIFLLEGGGSDATFRLSGGWLEALRERPLGGVPFGDLWTDGSTTLVVPALAQSLREARPVVIVGHRGPETAAVEVSVAPLRSRDGRSDLFLGLVAPAAGLDPGAGDRRLTARLTIAVGDRGRPALSLIEGRRSA